MKKFIAAFVLTVLLLSMTKAAEEWETATPIITTGETGTHFESGNIAIDSSEPIRLVLEDVPNMVTMQIEPVSSIHSSTEILLSGFLPKTTYHKYEDNYHNHIAFTRMPMENTPTSKTSQSRTSSSSRPGLAPSSYATILLAEIALQ